jgi:hypothetical protein
LLLGLEQIALEDKANIKLHRLVTLRNNKILERNSKKLERHMASNQRFIKARFDSIRNRDTRKHNKPSTTSPDPLEQETQPLSRDIAEQATTNNPTGPPKHRVEPEIRRRQNKAAPLKTPLESTEQNQGAKQEDQARPTSTNSVDKNKRRKHLQRGRNGAAKESKEGIVDAKQPRRRRRTTDENNTPKEKESYPRHKAAKNHRKTREDLPARQEGLRHREKNTTLEH